MTQDTTSSSPHLPEPGNAHEKLVVVETPVAPIILPPPSRRRRFIGGLAASTAAVIGGCSREPMSRESFADFMARLETSGSDFLERAKRELDQRFDEGEPFIVDLETTPPTPKRSQQPRFKKPSKPKILPSESEYATYLTGLGLKYIRPHEVLRPHRNVRSGIANQLPPKNLWNQMAPTLRVADKIRARLGSRLSYINSAYRSPAYNAKCPGAASRSYHMKNCALDLMFDCGSETAFAMARKLRSEGIFKGGIGLYGSFIHIDTRGYASTWGAA